MIQEAKNIIRQIVHYSTLVLEETNYDDYRVNKRSSNLGYSNSCQKQRTDWIVSRIEEGSTILDIACGYGAILLYMKSKKDFDAIGTDISHIA